MILTNRLASKKGRKNISTKHMRGDPELLRHMLEEALTSTGMVVVPAEDVAEKIVEAARNEPEDLFLDEGLLKEMVS